MESRHYSRRRRGSSTPSYSASPPRMRRSPYRRELPLLGPLTSDNHLSTNYTRHPPNPFPQRRLRRPRQLDRHSSLSYPDDPLDQVTEQNLWLETAANELQTHHHVTTTGGLSEDTILRHLKTRTVVEKPTASEDEICSICHIEIEENNRIGTLDCGHEYHIDCITAWIKLKNQCPLCRRTGLTLSNGAD